MSNAVRRLPRQQPTRLLGREGDLEDIEGLLLRDGVRLLTITGPAGVGKTRLAIEVGHRTAREFAHGVTFVDLHAIRDPSVVPSAVAAAVGLQDPESPRLLERLVAYLGECRSLLILDNFEQLLPAAGWLVDLLSTCPDVTLMVTSREALRLRWEHSYKVQPLALPDPDALPPAVELAQVPAVALFLDRARAIGSGFVLSGDNARTVVEICVRLDGLPLAIELAAARTNLLSPRMILDRLGRRLSMLRWDARDLPARQQTLRSAIGWSYDLLNDMEQGVFKRLGVFTGSFTMDAAQAVASAGDAEDGDRSSAEEVLDHLASIVGKSLMQVHERAARDTRYRLLESVREYALEQLEARDDAEAARRAHAHHFLALAERAAPELTGPRQRAWFSRLEDDHDDLRAALRWLHARGDSARSLRLAAALGYFWWVRGYYSEGRRHLDELVAAAPTGATDARTLAHASNWLGVLLLFQGERERARTVLEDARAVALSANDPRSITVSLLCLGLHAKVSGAWDKSTPLLEEALDRSRQAGDAWGAARSVHDLGITALYARDHARAQRLLEEARAGYRRLGDERSLAEALLWLGIATRERGEVRNAIALVRQALVRNRRLLDRRVITLGVDAVLWLVGDTAVPEDVRRLMAMNEALRQAMGFAHGVWDQTLFAPRIAALGDRLGDERAVAPGTKGYALSMEQVAALSLEVLDAAAPPDASPKETTGTSERGMLSPRESEVLRLVAEGHANREIAGRLFIAERTVRYHLTSIFAKLGADNRTQAVAFARRRSLL